MVLCPSVNVFHRFFDEKSIFQQEKPHNQGIYKLFLTVFFNNYVEFNIVFNKCLLTVFSRRITNGNERIKRNME